MNTHVIAGAGDAPAKTAIQERKVNLPPTVNACSRLLIQTLSLIPRPVPQLPSALLGRPLPRRQDGAPQINKIMAVDSPGPRRNPSSNCNVLIFQNVPRCSAPNRSISVSLSKAMLRRTKNENGAGIDDPGSVLVPYSGSPAGDLPDTANHLLQQQKRRLRALRRAWSGATACATRCSCEARREQRRVPVRAVQP